jgi:hypothetical protein
MLAIKNTGMVKDGNSSPTNRARPKEAPIPNAPVSTKSNISRSKRAIGARISRIQGDKLSEMTPNQNVTLDQVSMAHLISMEYSLKRIAHAIEHIAKQNDPDFKTLQETVKS